MKSLQVKRALALLGAARPPITVAHYLLDPQVQAYGRASVSDFKFAGKVHKLP